MFVCWKQGIYKRHIALGLKISILHLFLHTVTAQHILLHAVSASCHVMVSLHGLLSEYIYICCLIVSVCLLLLVLSLASLCLVASPFGQDGEDHGNEKATKASSSPNRRNRSQELFLLPGAPLPVACAFWVIFVIYIYIYGVGWGGVGGQ